MKLNNFEETLPEGRQAVYSLDIRDSKTALLFTLFSLVLTAAAALAVFLILQAEAGITVQDILYSLDSVTFWFLAIILVYMILHELVHGLVYQKFTGKKLKFGFNGLAAWCGIPDIYVYRRPALIACLAPFVVFSVLLPAGMLISAMEWKILFAAVFSLHIGGCAGDLWLSAVLLFRYRGYPELLVRDSGPTQTLYL